MRKTSQFKELLNSGQTEFLMEAHNGLSAKIVEETGFKGIWASGLSISAALGVRDNNEASWTQILEVVEFMSDATNVPILLDGDTGYGNFNNMRRLVQKLEQRGVAAVCIEDKLFPKTNSFIKSEKQPLADADEFAGKIAAGKDAQRDSDFCIVARTEGFIAGWGLEETLKRAEKYYKAGADAILVHSKISTPKQVVSFAEAWDYPCPIVIVPTMYYSTPVEAFENAGISLVIWANHNMRSAVQAMRQTSQQIYSERSLCNVEDKVIPVKEVFRLQNAEELMLAEERYLPKRADDLKVVILAASRGEQLGALTIDKPKAMVPVAGKPLLEQLVDHFTTAKIKDLVVVRGYCKDSIQLPSAFYVDHEDYENTGELVSLSKAENHIEGETIISFGDILFRQYILNSLLAAQHDITLVVDAAWQRKHSAKRYADYVSTSVPYSLDYSEENISIKAFSSSLTLDEIDGEWIGLMKLSAAGAIAVRSALSELQEKPDFRQLRFSDLFKHLMDKGQTINVVYISGHWLDIDDLDDLEQAYKF